MVDQDTSRYRGNSPELVVVTSQEGLGALNGLLWTESDLYKEIRDPVKDLDYSEWIALVVFRGNTPLDDTWCGRRIDGITWRDDQVTLQITFFVRPPPPPGVERESPLELTSPSVVIAIPRQATWEGKQLTFRLAVTEAYGDC
jgi:hypothetical protein